MLGSIGMPELIVILVIALMVFGPKRLPELGKSLGLTINEFKKGANALRDSVEAEIERDNHRQQSTAPAAPVPPLPPVAQPDTEARHS
ncbi:MAG TPA: twin-arginine translocase TatA/TatE family subunit [Vicinamibacterales bacterium]|jgi:sec-independent protein translocase protein TatA|nr:twin-arginine translocase TatA/TatE family subunit [Vicinamibacterales bacterium]